MGSTQRIIGTIMSEYNGGMTTAEIAKRHDVSSSAVLRALRKRGNVRPPVSGILTAGAPRFDGKLAACRDMRPEIFFDGRQSAYAKTICSVCPIRDACAAYAIPIADLCGVWGGLTMDERKQVRNRWKVRAQ